MTNKLNKKNTGKMMKKGASLLVAAILSAVLLSGQAAVAFGQTKTGVETDETSRLIPENVTIEDPVPLSEIVLPQPEEGILSWADEDFVPCKRVQKCEVQLEPAEGVALSYLEDWDEEKGVVVSHITVVVNSIPAEDDDEYEAEDAEYVDAENDSETVTEDTENTDTEDADTDGRENGSIESEDSENKETDTEEAPSNPEASENAGSEDTDSESAETPKDAETPNNTEDVKDPADAENPADSENPEKTEDTGSEAVIPDNSADMGIKDSITGGELTPETPEIPETSSEEQKETSKDSDSQENADNIFDRPAGVTKEDNRPMTAEADLTREEMDARAAENHTFAGISVTGINLPWYVQFRVSSGEKYKFTNKSDAAIFQSYEFELWDLQNNTEYEIPDGEYISVTVPVKEGYDYIIEHLLDSGAMETIIPSVDGGTMIFSTHSFSPFGIAGSKPIVGSEITEDGYSDDSSEDPAETGVAALDKKETGSGNAVTDKKDSVTDNKNNTDNKNSADNKTNTDNTDTQNNQQKSVSSDNVNTGDDTPILPFVLLIAVAVIVAAVVVVLKKKHK